MERPDYRYDDPPLYPTTPAPRVTADFVASPTVIYVVERPQQQQVMVDNNYTDVPLVQSYVPHFILAGISCLCCCILGLIAFALAGHIQCLLYAIGLMCL